MATSSKSAAHGATRPYSSYKQISTYLAQCRVCEEKAQRSPMVACLTCGVPFHTVCVGLSDMTKADWYCSLPCFRIRFRAYIRTVPSPSSKKRKFKAHDELKYSVSFDRLYVQNRTDKDFHPPFPELEALKEENERKKMDREDLRLRLESSRKIQQGSRSKEKIQAVDQHAPLRPSRLVSPLCSPSRKQRDEEEKSSESSGSTVSSSWDGVSPTRESTSCRDNLAPQKGTLEIDNGEGQGEEGEIIEESEGSSTEEERIDGMGAENALEVISSSSVVKEEEKRDQSVLDLGSELETLSQTEGGDPLELNLPSPTFVFGGEKRMQCGFESRAKQSLLVAYERLYTPHSDTVQGCVKDMVRAVEEEMVLCMTGKEVSSAVSISFNAPYDKNEHNSQRTGPSMGRWTSTGAVLDPPPQQRSKLSMVSIAPRTLTHVAPSGFQRNGFLVEESSSNTVCDSMSPVSWPSESSSASSSSLPCTLRQQEKENHNMSALNIGQKPRVLDSTLPTRKRRREAVVGTGGSTLILLPATSGSVAVSTATESDPVLVSAVASASASVSLSVPVPTSSSASVLVPTRPFWDVQERNTVRETHVDNQKSAHSTVLRPNFVPGGCDTSTGITSSTVTAAKITPGLCKRVESRTGSRRKLAYRGEESVLSNEHLAVQPCSQSKKRSAAVVQKTIKRKIKKKVLPFRAALVPRVLSATNSDLHNLEGRSAGRLHPRVHTTNVIEEKKAAEQKFACWSVSRNVNEDITCIAPQRSSCSVDFGCEDRVVDFAEVMEANRQQHVTYNATHSAAHSAAQNAAHGAALSVPMTASARNEMLRIDLNAAGRTISDREKYQLKRLMEVPKCAIVVRCVPHDVPFPSTLWETMVHKFGDTTVAPFLVQYTKHENGKWEEPSGAPKLTVESMTIREYDEYLRGFKGAENTQMLVLKEFSLFSTHEMFHGLKDVLRPALLELTSFGRINLRRSCDEIPPSPLVSIFPCAIRRNTTFFPRDMHGKDVVYQSLSGRYLYRIQSEADPSKKPICLIGKPDEVVFLSKTCKFDVEPYGSSAKTPFVQICWKWINTGVSLQGMTTQLSLALERKENWSNILRFAETTVAEHRNGVSTECKSTLKERRSRLVALETVLVEMANRMNLDRRCNVNTRLEPPEVEVVDVREDCPGDGERKEGLKRAKELTNRPVDVCLQGQIEHCSQCSSKLENEYHLCAGCFVLGGKCFAVCNSCFISGINPETHGTVARNCTKSELVSCWNCCTDLDSVHLEPHNETLCSCHTVFQSRFRVVSVQRFVKIFTEISALCRFFETEP